MTTPDITVENHGSIFLLRPVTEAGSAWIEEHTPEDRQYFGSALVVEHRYVSNIVSRMIDDGLVVE